MPMTNGDVFGIIGCGMISTFHARAISDVPGAKLIACFDVVEKSIENMSDSR